METSILKLLCVINLLRVVKAKSAGSVRYGGKRSPWSYHAAFARNQAKQISAQRTFLAIAINPSQEVLHSHHSTVRRICFL